MRVIKQREIIDDSWALSPPGAPIANDRWYPRVTAAAPDDGARPLKLLARTLEFVDPLDGAERRIESRFTIRAE